MVLQFCCPINTSYTKMFPEAVIKFLLLFGNHSFCCFIIKGIDSEDGSIYLIYNPGNLRGTAGSEFSDTPAAEPLHFEIVRPRTVPSKEIEVTGEAAHLLNDGNTVILRNGGTDTEVIHDNVASRKHFPNNLTGIPEDTQIGFVPFNTYRRDDDYIKIAFAYLFHIGGAEQTIPYRLFQ